MLEALSDLHHRYLFVLFHQGFDGSAPDHSLVFLGVFVGAVILQVVIDVFRVDEFSFPFIDEPIDGGSGDVEQLGVVFGGKFFIVLFAEKIFIPHFCHCFWRERGRLGPF